MKTEDLEKKYPKIFETLYYPISVGNGWIPLIDSLCHYLQWQTDKNERPQIEAVQVKEKFGSLRFYTNGQYQEAKGAIEFAEYLSGRICEECGSMTEIGKTKGWIITLCINCKDLEKFERYNWTPIKTEENE